MVFKRREKQSFWRRFVEFLYPRGGWARAYEYVKLRVHRLPDSPERIARGIWAGVFTAFTPFYGLHFVIAASLAFAMRGNVIAAILGTFFGNPLTYVPIGVVSLQTGYFFLGIRPRGDLERSLGGRFVDAGADLWHNFKAIFTDDVARWGGLAKFWDDVFFPYMIGGILPGIIAATAMYFVSVPVIRAYQNRRKGRIRAKIAEIKQKAMAKKLKDQEGS
ncbi:MAG: DUF2062 domain-containing protein [Pseudomonadota bacterium]